MLARVRHCVEKINDLFRKHSLDDIDHSQQSTPLTPQPFHSFSSNFPHTSGRESVLISRTTMQSIDFTDVESLLQTSHDFKSKFYYFFTDPN